MIDSYDIRDWFEEHTKGLLILIPIIILLIYGIIALFEYEAVQKKEIEITKSGSGQIVMLEGRDKELMLAKFESDYAEGYEFISIGKDADGEYIFVISQREEN